jgi:Pyridoxamine 5'-phosphate oxidase
VASWSRLEREAPEFAGRLRGFLEARAHKTLATLRRDGSPRISGIEATIAGDELLFGGMPGSRKVDDLRRDPRFALHSGSEEPAAWRGDGKLAGSAVEVVDPDRRRELLGDAGAGGGGGVVFCADIQEASIVRLGEPPDHLVVEVWKPGQPLRAMRRD